MKSLITIIALLLVASVATPAPAVARELDCDSIAGYLDHVDTAMADEVHAVVTAPGWAEDAQGLTNTGGASEDVTAETVEPLLRLFSIPASVLGEMDADDIPDDALALHESAVGFWDTLPRWIAAEIDGDEAAWEAAMVDLGAYGEDNGEAQAAIDDACPGLIEGYMDNVDALGVMFDELDGNDGTPVALAESSPEDLDGIGVYFLVMPSGMAGAFAQPDAVATPVRDPATVKVVAPGSSPAATPGS